MNWLKTVSELVSKSINLKVVFSLSLGVLTLLFLDWWAFFNLSKSNYSVKDYLIIFFVLSFLTPLVYFFLSIIEKRYSTRLLQQRNEIRQFDQEKHNKQIQKEVIKRIEYLNSGELDYLVNCLKESETTFAAYSLCSNAISLKDKGIITPSSIHDPCNQQAFTICDFVWDYLLKNNAQINKKYADKKKLERAAKRQKSKRVRY